MNNDLISREALKKAIDHLQYTDDFCVKHQIDNSISLYMLEKIIDNATTVEYPFYQEAYQTGYEEGKNEMEEAYRLLSTAYEHEVTKEDRPQGEWLKSDVPESVLAKCSVCGFDCGAYTHNFCPNCGAEMRKGGTE